MTPSISASSHENTSPIEPFRLYLDSEDETPEETVRDKVGGVIAGEVVGGGDMHGSGPAVKQMSSMNRARLERKGSGCSMAAKKRLTPARVADSVTLKGATAKTPDSSREKDGECIVLDSSTDSENEMEGDRRVICLSSAESSAGDRGGEERYMVATGSSVDLEHPEFKLTPGSFEVILIVDSSESSASRK